MPKRGRTEQEIQQAVAEYVSGLTLSEVARSHGVNETTAAGWMRAAGVSRPRGSTRHIRAIGAKRVAALLDLATSGDSLSVVAHRHGVAKTTLAMWQDADRDLAYEGDWVRVGGILRPVEREAS